MVQGRDNQGTDNWREEGRIPGEEAEGRITGGKKNRGEKCITGGSREG